MDKIFRLLVCCEESQRVCTAFRARGWEAYSCDIEPCSGGHPEWHIMQDVLPLINGDCTFTTMDGVEHYINGQWDLLICHPPCTYLSNAGACRLYPRKGQLDMERYAKGLEAKQFFMAFLNANCAHIVVENPIPSKVFDMPLYTQIVQPFEYGDPFSKKTCLWEIGVPLLIPTNVLTEYKPWVSCGTSKNKGNPDKAGFSRAGGVAKVRARTFEGIAQAMADQWGKFIEEQA